MTAVLAAALKFLLSPDGLTIVGTAAVWLWHKAVKSKDRRSQLLEYAQQAWMVAEVTGLKDKLPSNAKLNLFISTIAAALKADGQKALSDTEREMLRELAARTSAADKFVTGRAEPIPAGMMRVTMPDGTTSLQPLTASPSARGKK